MFDFKKEWLLKYPDRTFNSIREFCMYRKCEFMHRNKCLCFRNGLFDVCIETFEILVALYGRSFVDKFFTCREIELGGFFDYLSGIQMNDVDIIFLLDINRCKSITFRNFFDLFDLSQLSVDK